MMRELSLLNYIMILVVMDGCVKIIGSWDTPAETTGTMYHATITTELISYNWGLIILLATRSLPLSGAYLS